MPELSKDLVALLQYLAPGFVVAWVFYGLTSHIKPTQFERVVQALIFTVVVQLVVLAERSALEFLGRCHSFGSWSHNSDLYASLLTAIALGVAMSACINADAMHRLVRELGISSKSGHPCEWFGIFYDYQRYIVLQLKDGTRVFGWPKIWPSEPENGHFFITNAVRTVGDEEQDLSHLEGLLINVQDVAFVEFVKESTTP